MHRLIRNSFFAVLCVMLAISLPSCPNPNDDDMQPKEEDKPSPIDTVYFSVEGMKASNGNISAIGAYDVEITGDFSKFSATSFKVLDYGHVISKSTNRPTLQNNNGYSALGSRDAAGVFVSKIVNLSPNTTYYARVYVKIRRLSDNSIVVSYHEFAISFRTKGLILAEVKTGTPFDINSTFVSVPGQILNAELTTIIEHGHVWSRFPLPTLDKNDGKSILGSLQPVKNHTFTTQISNLDPFTSYYARAYAQNSIGISYGESVLFTTPKNPEKSITVRNAWWSNVSFKLEGFNQNLYTELKPGESRLIAMTLDRKLSVWECIENKCGDDVYTAKPGMKYKIVQLSGTKNYDLSLVAE